MTNLVQDVKLKDKVKNLTRIDYLEGALSMSTISMPRLEQLMQNASPDEWALSLKLMSPTQRQYLWDQASWVKDDFNLAQFKFWVVILAHLDCEAHENEQVLKQFVTSENFLVYLKSAFTISLIDPEEPVFPDHDHYFVSDDNQFVFEYDPALLSEEQQNSQEMVKESILLVKQFYNHYGVNQAYFILHTLVGEQYLSFLEDKYQESVRRMELLGFPSYIKALQITSVFHQKSELDFFIKNILARKIFTNSSGELFTTKSIEKVVPPKQSWEMILEQDLRLEEFPQWSVINLSQIVNALIVLEKSKKISFDSFLSTQQLRTMGKKVHQHLSLGKSYLQEAFSCPNAYTQFSFQEVFKIGRSLIAIGQHQLNKISSNFKQFEMFRGEFWDDFYEKSFSPTPSLKNLYKTHPFDYESISDYSTYIKWLEMIQALGEQVNVMKQYHEKLTELVDENVIHDSFYSTIKIAQMDFQNIITTNFVNFSLKSTNKLGVLEEDFEKFMGIPKENLNWNEFLENTQLHTTLAKVHTKIFHSFILDMDDNCVILFAKGH